MNEEWNEAIEAAAKKAREIWGDQKANSSGACACRDIYSAIRALRREG